MSSISRRVALVGTACLLLGGGALTAVAFGANGKPKHHTGASLLKAGTTTTSTTTTPSGSNEDPAHEAGETAAQEAQENATGHGAGGPGNGAFKPNEDPAHEAGESAAREAQEDAGRRPTVP